MKKMLWCQVSALKIGHKTQQKKKFKYKLSSRKENIAVPNLKTSPKIPVKTQKLNKINFGVTKKLFFEFKANIKIQRKF